MPGPDPNIGSRGPLEASSSGPEDTSYWTPSLLNQARTRSGSSEAPKPLGPKPSDLHNINQDPTLRIQTSPNILRHSNAMIETSN